MISFYGFWNDGTLFAIVMGVISWCTVAWMMLGGRSGDLWEVVGWITGAQKRREARDEKIYAELLRHRDESIKWHTERIAAEQEANNVIDITKRVA